MQADISRRTFDPADAYRAVLLQQGRVLLDADFNEQTEITAHHDEVRTRDLVGRSGGPSPDPAATGVAALGPFALVGADGAAPTDPAAASAASAWADLRVTPGRYYVDGVLCESPGPDEPGGAPDERGWLLVDQPYLAAVAAGGLPGLAEPDGAADGDRYALYLDVWDRHVTADEDPALLEPALGGPDTTTRAQTVWQVKVFGLDGAGGGSGGGPTLCPDLHAPGFLAAAARRMAAFLDPAGPDDDPCELTGTGGYERLENQLYRVQIHRGTPPPGKGTPDPETFTWSRDNGSVVAGLLAVDVVDAAARTAALTLDRLGRDEELSFAADQLVEVTSTDLQQHGVPGFLARTGTPTLVADAGGASSTLSIPVTWLEDVPPGYAELGRAPIVRRWEGGPLPVTAAGVPLEAGIGVRFPTGGRTRTGDYWLVPARTVRLAYGLTQLSGTIEWPPGGRGPDEQPPVGPRHHVAPLAIVRRDGAGWVLDSDCRLLFPALTDLVTIDLVGGDGQEAPPEQPLPEPVRVAVRNGGRPVAGARIGVDAGTGHVSAARPPDAASPSTLPDPASGTAALVTAADGVATVRWALDPAGPTTQTLTLRRLDARDAGLDVPVVVTGRLSVASEVAWTPPRGCTGFATTGTVQEALTGLVRLRELRLLGGDGQSVERPGRVVPQPVRVVVDSPCGPLAKVEVTAVAGDAFTGPGLVVEAVAGQRPPTTLDGTPARATAVATTDENGVASFSWQPAFDKVRSATLDVFLAEDKGAPVRVAAELDPAGGGAARTPGLHVEKVTWGNGRAFLNDAVVSPREPASGVSVTLDGPVALQSVRGKPVVRMMLALPWPVGAAARDWSDTPVGFQELEVLGDATADGSLLVWRPRNTEATPVIGWLEAGLWDALARHKWTEPIIGRFVVDGWALVGEGDADLHMNGHAATRLAGGRTDVVLPTDDEVTGGTFTQWFRLTDRVGPNDDGGRGERVVVSDVVGRTRAVAVRLLTGDGLVPEVVEEPDAEVRRGQVLRTDPAAHAEVEPGSTVVVAVSSGRPG
jgi:Family of unknown function (DUF6519)/PASTA domain